MKFERYNRDNAPEKSKPLLEKSVRSFGMIPNLHAVLAASPAALEAYQALHQLFQQSSFDAQELTVVWQTINVEHECHYCVAAHTGIAHKMAIDAELIQNLRDAVELSNPKLQTLHLTTIALLRNRGRLTEQELAEFAAAGYEQKHLLDIILGISQKVLSNYANHQALTPLDQPFKPYEWYKP